MEARAKLLGHAIHQMLIPYPLALLTTAIIFDVVHLFTDNPLWSTMAYWMIAAGIIGGLASALFGFIDWLVRSWFGKLVLIGYTWAMFHHMLGGLRHLVWDTGAGLEKHTASKIAWATLAGSILLTLIVWAVYLSIA